MGSFETVEIWITQIEMCGLDREEGGLDREVSGLDTVERWVAQIQEMGGFNREMDGLVGNTVCLQL